MTSCSCVFFYRELRLALTLKPYWPSWRKLQALDEVTVESMKEFVGTSHELEHKQNHRHVV